MRRKLVKVVLLLILISISVAPPLAIGRGRRAVKQFLRQPHTWPQRQTFDSRADSITVLTANTIISSPGVYEINAADVIDVRIETIVPGGIYEFRRTNSSGVTIYVNSPYSIGAYGESGTSAIMHPADEPDAGLVLKGSSTGVSLYVVSYDGTLGFK